MINKDNLRDDKRLRDAMFTDLTNFWSNYTGATVTKGLHDAWRADNIHMGMVTRLGRSLIHGAACGNGIFRGDLDFCVGHDTTCRGGCQTVETMDHVLLECPCYATERLRVKSVCNRMNIRFCMRNMLTDPELLPSVEDLFIAVYRT